MNQRTVLALHRSPLRSCIKVIFICAVATGLMGCAKNKLNQIDLMPAPEVYTDGSIDPCGLAT